MKNCKDDIWDDIMVKVQNTDWKIPVSLNLWHTVSNRVWVGDSEQVIEHLEIKIDNEM